MGTRLAEGHLVLRRAARVSAFVRQVGWLVTDRELVSLVAQKESWALAELYDRYVRLVFSIALEMLSDRSTAEEIVQEVFARVWRAAGMYAPERGQFSSWLISITRNICIDELRRRRARPHVDSVDEELFWEVADEEEKDDPVQAAAYSYERERVRAALARIPAEQREAIELAFFKDLTHEEIARHCNQPLGTIKTRVRLGMQKLRELLKEG